jgi:DNA-binding transcriptional LysR family regulator
LNIENIEAFVYVIHFNSFNKAADALFLSQPSISARIQSLERELDAKLFDREGRQFSLTEKGKQFLPFAQQILHAYKKSKQHLQQMKTSLHELRIGCTVSVSNYVMPELLPRFKEQYPDMQIKLLTASTETILERVVNKELDLGFVRNVTHPHVDSVPFYEDQIRLFVYKGHPFIDREEISIEDVAGQPLVFFECGSLDWMKIHRLFETLDQQPTIEFHIDNLETAKKLVAAGMGISFLPELCVRKEIQEKRLFPIKISSMASLSLRTNFISLKGEATPFLKLFQKLGRGIDFSSSAR